MSFVANSISEGNYNLCYSLREPSDDIHSLWFLGVERGIREGVLAAAQMIQPTRRYVVKNNNVQVTFNSSVNETTNAFERATIEEQKDNVSCFFIC